MSMINYSQRLLREFITMYRSLPCLWQVNSVGYRDKNIRNRAYDILIEKLREANVNADRNEVTRRINILRTAFRREYKKSCILKKKFPQARFKSSLWYYDLMKFVVDSKDESMEECMTNDDINEDLMEFKTYHEDMLDSIVKTELLVPASPEPLPSFQSVSLQPTVTETNSLQDCGRRESEVGKRKRCRTVRDASPSANTGRTIDIASKENDYDFQTFGNYVIAKLRRSTTRQSMIAEKIIADVLMRANLGTLTETTCLSGNAASDCLIMSDK